MSKDKVEQPSQTEAAQEGKLIQGAYGSSNLPLDFLTGKSGKFWENTESYEEVIAAALRSQADLIAAGRLSPPPARASAPEGHGKEKGKRQRSEPHQPNQQQPAAQLPQ